ncbi:RDD family protein [Photobacterium lipolyticum]|uniref:WIF domain-containing protein n=1 Tax=Photobacterium lipolyticum TaxID=266810 RepID=A0A2T3N1U8_9GAMM|nr:RDD family protein [Photobacterium lipolyticum]PSW06164.1 hypothetical protein C9I89_06550 [Photobacterium lipolyticum]
MIFVRRFFAYFIDVLPITLLSVAFFWFFRDLEPAFYNYIANKSDVQVRLDFQLVKIQVREFASLLCLIYFIIFECSGSLNTFGKHACGIRVVQLDGSNITLKQSLKRNSLKFFSVLIIGLGFLYPLFNKERLFLHDKMSGTRVIRRSQL